MLVVNADYNAGEFYRRRVSNLCPNQFYRFSTWILNLHSDSANVIRPNVTLQILDTTICNGQSIILDAGSGFKSYELTTIPPTFSQTLEVSTVGTYSVILTGNNGCSATQTVNVTAGVTPTIVNINSTENSIEIIATGGNPPYSYSLDNHKPGKIAIFSPI